MRPLSLQLRGLHGFREPVEVDLAHLGAYGLFGIFGPVGAGKSTLLDAITLALYGVVDRNQGRRLKGIVNSGSDRTDVRFDFTIRDGDQDVPWSVERHYKADADRAAQRTASRLMRLDTGEVVADKEKDVAEAVDALVGLAADDFLRAVVLPQGRFMELLHLRGEARRALLQRLFGLVRFGDDLRHRLRAREIRLEKDVEHGEGELAGLGDLPDDALVRAETARAEAEARRDASRRELESTRAQLAAVEAADGAQRRLDLAVDALRAASEADGALRRKRAAVAAAIRRDAMAEPTRRLNEARATMAAGAADMAAQADELTRTETDCAQATQELAAADEALAGQGPVWREAVARLGLEARQQQQRLDARATAKAARTAADKAARLATDAGTTRQRADAQLLRAEADRDRLAQAWAASEADAAERARAEAATAALADAIAATRRGDEARDRLRREAAEQTDAARALAESEAFLQELRGRAGTIGRVDDVDLDAVLARIEALDRDLAAHDAAQAALPPVQAACAEARAALTEATASTALRRKILRDAEAALREAEHRASLASAAARCAADLRAGNPCPACGSASHPSPAAPPDPLVEATVAAHSAGRSRATERLDAATEIEAQARAADAVAAADHARARAAVDDAAQRLGRHRPDDGPDEPAVWRSRWVVQADRARQARADAATLADLVAQIARAEAPLVALRARLDAAEDRVRHARADSDLADEQSARAWARMYQERPDAPVFELQRRSRATDAPGDTVSLREALDEADRAVAEARRARDKAARDEAKKREAAAEALGRVTGAADTATDDLPFDESALPRAREALDLLERTRAIADARARAAQQRLTRARDAAADARARHAAARVVHDDRAAAWQDATERLGPQPEDADASDLPEAGDLPALEAELAAHADRMLRATSAVAAARSDRDALGHPPPRAEVATRAALAAQRFEDAVAELAARTSNRDDVARRAPRVSALRQQMATGRAHLDRVGALSNLLRGNKFVDWLAEDALGDLVGRASVHLRGLTEDRYALGLDADAAFVVSDADAGGAVRPVASLSGGETFLASLALALALSEQVAARGRRPLDFFFLDEGFGSLDAASLDRALGAIEALPRDRRIVGVVSHVPGVRERMPRWLEVSPATRELGARVRIVDG